MDDGLMIWTQGSQGNGMTVLNRKEWEGLFPLGLAGTASIHLSILS